MGNKIYLMTPASCFPGSANINPFYTDKKESAPVCSSDESTKSAPAVPSTSVTNQSEAGIRKRLQLQTPRQRTRPSLRINILGSLPVRSDGDNNHETFIRFNELVNALEGLRMIPDDVQTALETSNKASASNDGGVPMLATLVRAYRHGGPVTKYAIGEALAELVGSGRLNPPESTTDSGYICKTMLQKARQMDPVLDLLMSHLLGEDGDIKPVDSPLPRATKETHSPEFMALCTRSSRRGAIDMPGTRFVIDELKAQVGKPFAGVHLYQVQHGFDTDETQARGLFELGMEPKNLWYFPKTGARPLVLGRLGNMGSNIYDKPYDLRSSRNSTTGHLVQFLDKSFGIEGKSIAEQIETLTAYKTGTHPASSVKPKILLVDSGFKIGKSLVELQLSTESLVRQKYALIAELCPMVAHTQGDIIKGNKALRDAEKVAKERNIAVPILPRAINMAQSPAKDFEGFSVGHEVWLATNRFLDKMAPPEVIAQRPKEALLMGYGIVSAKAQAPLQAGYDVWVWDIDPASLLRAYTDHEKIPGEGTGKVHVPVSREILERVMGRGGKRDDPEFVQALAAAKKDWFSHGHITIGNTGAPVGCLHADDFDLLPNGAILSSGASGDYEFGTTKARKSNPSLTNITAEDGNVKFPIGGPAVGESHEVPVASGDESSFDHQVFETKSGTPDAKRFMIVRGGYAANRLYGIPPPFIDVVKAIMIRSMYEAIQPHSDSRPPSGLWLVDPDSAAQDRVLGVIQKSLTEKNLGMLDEPNFANADLNWHRPSMPPSPRALEPAERAGYTSERFVHSGLSACRTYNISPSSFALICDGVSTDLFASEDLHLLHQEMFSTQAANGVVALEVARPQRSIAHTLYSIFARKATAPKEGLDAKINAARKHLGIDDHQWATLLASPDEFGFTPSHYAVLPEETPEGGADDLQRARRSMQDCIAVLSIGAPTREQLKGISDRKERLMSDFHLSR